MFKLVTSPLLIFILGLIGMCVVTRPGRRWGKGLPRSTWACLLLVTLGLAAVSMPSIASFLARSLETNYPYPSEERLAAVEVMVVLSAGVQQQVGAGRLELDQESYARTVTASRAFLAAQPRLLVMQGTLARNDVSGMAELMAELAVHMGVPAERIRIEDRSRNTREHPVELLRLEDVSPDHVIGVVTSRWHLPRAVVEYERYFTHVVPIPADSIVADRTGTYKDWIPQIDGLQGSTRVIHEWVGRMWYAIVSLKPERSL